MKMIVSHDSKSRVGASRLILVGELGGFAGFADAAAAQPGVDDLLEPEGDDEADGEREDVDEDGGWLLRCVCSSYRMAWGCGYGCL